MMASPMCRRCQIRAETIEHIFWECPPAKDTWEQLHMVWASSDDNSDFIVWLKNTFESRSMALCRMTVCALWVLWTSRNKFIHGGENQIGVQIARWTALMGSRLKVNFDAAFNNHNKESCSGEANRVAYCLAQEGLKKRESTYLTNLVSPSAVEAVAEDRRWTEVVGEERWRRNEGAEESVLEF
ncbi:hypothetical protein GOBAR_AA17706 [Gossypium barbadense]|uniref:Reverse transcriptase zinc-binding domain-containing protein n=1 Tax=Gossypium barbadense TaxID=3634 RepID=A0A2P5XHX2_GOSBA|nr:hypothetical protein GOBAR_AA17706 [Gossypium barbadense]